MIILSVLLVLVSTSVHIISMSEKHTVNPSTLKIETVCFSETLSYTYESTRRQNPDHHHKNYFKTLLDLNGEWFLSYLSPSPSFFIFLIPFMSLSLSFPCSIAFLSHPFKMSENI
jgi:hypothetical protein